MDDIIATIPWRCNERDCGSHGGWHRSNYWAFRGEEYSEDRYGDGDHEPCGYSDIPTVEECNIAEREYTEYVARTGMDPLGEFMVKETITRNERWQFKWQPTIAGPIVRWVRWGGTSRTPAYTPEYVQEYLQVLGSPWRSGGALVMQGLSSDKLKELGHKPHVWCTVSIPHTTPRKHSTVTRELRKMARKALRRDA